MRKLSMVVGLAVVLLAAVASAEVTISLIGPALVAPDSDFDVDILVDLSSQSDSPISLLQVVLDSLDPSLTLVGVEAPLASVSFVNQPDTAVIDYFPNTYPDNIPGQFVAGTLKMHATVEGEYPLNLFVETGSTFSTAVFDELYNGSWAIIARGDVVKVGVEEIPEPVSMGLMALVGLGGVLAGRKKRA